VILIKGGRVKCPYSIDTNFNQTKMRKIESLMNDAITNSTDFKSANTEVQTLDGVSYVYLHGNKIAEVGNSFIRLFDGGYQTHTTKSRINAILSEHGLPGERVFAKNYTWFVNLMTSGGLAPVPFFSSMRLA
jgi:hypothetical protein